MRVFIAGIMQGSRLDKDVEDQGYRERIASAIRARVPDMDILDPWALHPDSPTYDFERGKQVYLSLNDAAAQAQVLVAYVPQASMGTAIEMWQAAYVGQAKVYCISPLVTNWVVRFLSDKVFPSIEAFEEFVAEGGMNGKIAN